MYIFTFNFIFISYDCLQKMIYDSRLRGITDFTFYNVNFINLDNYRLEICFQVILKFLNFMVFTKQKQMLKFYVK